MQQRSYAKQGRSIDKLQMKSKSISDHDSILSKTSVTRQQSNRSGMQSEGKRFDTIQPTIFEHRESFLDIRPYRSDLKSSNTVCNQSSLVTINVGGCRFQTYLSTLQLYPETLLGNDEKRKEYWNDETEEYFFDRHRACFESILYYYQSNGRLRRPNFVPLDTFLEEIAFFQLGPQALAQVYQTENIKVIQAISMPRMLWRWYLWFYLEFPQHSFIARLLHIISTILTILSCSALAIESLPYYNNYYQNICQEQANLSDNSTQIVRCPATYTSPFFLIQTVCVTYFTAEFVLRLLSTPSYIRFVFSFFNWIDFGAILPYFIFLGIELSQENVSLNSSAFLGIRLLRVLRFARMFKVYAVFHTLKPLRVLSATIRESLVDFTVMITILTLIAFLFGAIAYFAEQDVNGEVFDSIPKSVYWGIITITGVGYGDMYPISVVGRVMTCLCAFVGAGMMGMLVSVLVDRYQRVYNRKMYMPESELVTVDADEGSSSDDEVRPTLPTRQSLTLKRQLSSVIPRRLPLVQRKFKSDQRRSTCQSYKVQFVVSFDGEHLDNLETNDLVTTMKDKMTEAVTNTAAEVNFKSRENGRNSVWTTQTSGQYSTATSTTESILENTKPQPTQAF